MPAIPTLTVFTHAALFVFGFSLVFVVGWGGAATLLGQLFGQYVLALHASCAIHFAGIGLSGTRTSLFLIGC